MNFTLRTVLPITALLLAAASLPARAADTGFYAGIGVGAPSYPDRLNGISGSGSSLGGLIYGGYRLTPGFSIEAGLDQLGRSTNAQGALSAHAAFLDAVGTLPLNEHWSLLGRVGVAQMRFDTSAGDDGGAALKLGVGAEYAVAKDIALRGELTRYHADAFGANPDVAQYTFGVRFAF